MTQADEAAFLRALLLLIFTGKLQPKPDGGALDPKLGEWN